MATTTEYRMLKRSAWDGAHVKSVTAWALVHPASERPGHYAGRIVCNWSDNPAGSVCRATVHVWAGPLAGLPSTSGEAGGGGYDKFSAAVQDALARGFSNPDPRDRWTAPVPAPLDMDGRGASEVRSWFEQFGYAVLDVIG